MLEPPDCRAYGSGENAHAGAILPEPLTGGRVGVEECEMVRVSVFEGVGNSARGDDTRVECSATRRRLFNIISIIVSKDIKYTSASESVCYNIYYVKIALVYFKLIALKQQIKIKRWCAKAQRRFRGG